MKRTRWLFAYDIREPRRLRQTAKVMEAHGLRMQYSVFICDLTSSERMSLIEALGDIIDASSDCVACIELGDRDGDQFSFIGPQPPLPTSGATIV